MRYSSDINYKGVVPMMASTLRTFVFVTGAMIATGLVQAQQPAPSPKPAAQAAAPSASAASQSTQKPAGDTNANGSESAKAAPSTPAQKAPDPDAQLIKDAVNAGFKPKMIRGTQMFCRTAIELGSSFPVRTCYDADQVKVKIHEYAEERRQLEEMRSVGQPGP